MKPSEKYEERMLRILDLELEVNDLRMAAELVWTTATQDEYYVASMAFRRKLSELGNLARELARELAEVGVAQ